MTEIKATPAEHISGLIESLSDWRGKTLAELRKLILETNREIEEDWKWDTPVFTMRGNVVACGVFKNNVKLNFFKGAQLEDPHGMFNAGLDAKKSRAIDIYEDTVLDSAALRQLIQAAIELNQPAKK